MELLRSFAVLSWQGEDYAKTALFLLLTAMAGISLAEVSVTGNWSGSFTVTRENGESKDSTAFLKLKQSGSDVTGTVGPTEEEQSPIQKGKVDGDTITLEAVHQGHTIKLKLVLSGDRLKGDANMSGDGESATAKLDLTRAK
jgi:hypothetical protein